jgi:hypothetical protein
MKVAVGRCSPRGAALASISRLEDADSTGAAQLTAALVDGAGTTVRPCSRRTSTSTIRSTRHVVVSICSGTRITTSVASRRCPYVTWRAARRRRGDSHYPRVEAREWAGDNVTDYIFGLAGNAVLDALVAEAADNLCFCHATWRGEPAHLF